MSQHEELRKSGPDRDPGTSTALPDKEVTFEFADRNAHDASESNRAIKASMARELHSMGLGVEAISRVLRTDNSKVAEWINDKS